MQTNSQRSCVNRAYLIQELSSQNLLLLLVEACHSGVNRPGREANLIQELSVQPPFLEAYYSSVNRPSKGANLIQELSSQTPIHYNLLTSSKNACGWQEFLGHTNETYHARDGCSLLRLQYQLWHKQGAPNAVNIHPRDNKFESI